MVFLKLFLFSLFFSNFFCQLCTWNGTFLTPTDQLDIFNEGCTILDGDVFITDTTTNLTGLINIQQINGPLSISGTQISNLILDSIKIIGQFFIENNLFLETVSLTNVTVDSNLLRVFGFGTISISYNDLLTTIDADIPNIGTLRIEHNSVLNTINMSSLISVADLLLVNCPQLSSVDFSSLMGATVFNCNAGSSGLNLLLGPITVMNNLYLSYCGLVSLDSFNSLETVEQELLIQEPELTVVDLPNLKTVGMSLRISNCQSLTKLDGFNLLSDLGKVPVGKKKRYELIQGGLAIFNNLNLEFIGGFNGLDPELDSLYILQNINLKNISGFNSVQSFPFNFVIQDNIALDMITGFSNFTSSEMQFILCSSLIKNLNSFKSLANIEGTFELCDNSELQNLDILFNVSFVNLELILTNNIKLESIYGLAGKIVDSVTLSNNTNLECDPCTENIIFNWNSSGIVNSQCSVFSNVTDICQGNNFTSYDPQCSEPPCLQCSQGCTIQPKSFCGDLIVDISLNEECDPPNSQNCSEVCTIIDSQTTTQTTTQTETMETTETTQIMETTDTKETDSSSSVTTNPTTSQIGTIDAPDNINFCSSVFCEISEENGIEIIEVKSLNVVESFEIELNQQVIVSEGNFKFSKNGTKLTLNLDFTSNTVPLKIENGCLDGNNGDLEIDVPATETNYANDEAVLIEYKCLSTKFNTVKFSNQNECVSPQEYYLSGKLSILFKDTEICQDSKDVSSSQTNYQISKYLKYFFFVLFFVC